MTQKTPLTGCNQKHLDFRIRYGLVAGLAAITAVPATAAVEINVDTSSDVVSATDGVTSLREAINQANKALSSDVIINLPAGTYELEGADHEDGNASGDLDVFSHGNKTVTIRGAGRLATVIDGNSSDRIFDLAAGGNYVIEKMLLYRGYVAGSSGSDGTSNYLDTSGGISKLLYGEDGGDGGDAYGGAIHLAGGHLKIHDVFFSSCAVEGGDGGSGASAVSWFQVYAGDGGNGGNAAGGAIYADIGSTGSISLSQVDFTNIYAYAGTGGSGGFANDGIGFAQAGDGGNGGNAIGGALFIEGTGRIAVQHINAQTCGAYGGLGGHGSSALSAGTVEGGDGGDGGDAIGGFAYVDHKGSIASNHTALFSDFFMSSVYASAGDGGNAGDGDHFTVGMGGDGGNGGEAAGPSIYVDNAQFFHLGNSSEVDYTSFSYMYAYGGDGGFGGDASESLVGSASGWGEGGDGGFGGDAYGGMYIDNTNGYAQVTNHKIWRNFIYGGVGGDGGSAFVNNTFITVGQGGNGGDGGTIYAAGMYIENMDRYTEVDFGTSVTGSVWGLSAGLGGVAGSGGWNVGSTGSTGATFSGTTYWFGSPSTHIFSSASVGNQAWKEQGTTAAVSQIYNSGVDLPMKNIEVVLYDATGKIVGKTRTDDNGEYYFYTGYSGSAQIKFDVENQTPLGEGAGASANTNNDNDIEITSSGLTEIFTISGDDLTIDAGFSDAAPNAESFDLTVHGTVPNAYSAVYIRVNGSASSSLGGANSGGAGLRNFTVSATIPPDLGFVDLVAETPADVSTIRRVYVREVESGGN